MYSKDSIAWLNTFKNVQHDFNGGEINICGTKVDGFNQETNTVYQYHGCFWHGCPDCYQENTIYIVNQETMGDLHEKTTEKNKQITYAGFNLTEMLECKWLKSKDYKKVLTNPKTIVEPLIPEMPSMEVEQTPIKSKTKYYGILTLVLYIQLSSTLIITLQAIQRKFINQKTMIRVGKT